MSLLLLFNEAVAYIARTDVDLRAPSTMRDLTPSAVAVELGTSSTARELTAPSIAVERTNEDS